MTEYLHDAARRGIRYVETIHDRRVFPAPDAIEALQRFDEAFPADPTDPAEVIRMLDEIGSPATVATTGGRYYGFVTGAILPAALAAGWMTCAWDQNGAFESMTPVGTKLEAVAERWLLEALDLPADWCVSFVTGATMANFTGFAAARHYLLQRAGWDVEAQGLYGAPEIKVVVGEEVHVSPIQALAMAGLGRERVIRVPVDDQGRMRPDALPKLDDMTLLCLQSGNVNSGAFDPTDELCDMAHQAGAWVHVDGAFGLWARATDEKRHLAAGIEKADSIATDGHKWLNVSYDNGLLFCRHPKALVGAMSINAPYFVLGQSREPEFYTPEMSRRARGIEVWAALKSLGRSGLKDLVERDCRLASRLAEGLQKAGFVVLNEVVINQICVLFGDDAITRRIIAAVQAEGTMWAGPTVWKGQTAMRISVSSWATTADDIDRSLEAIIRVANEVKQSAS